MLLPRGLHTRHLVLPLHGPPLSDAIEQVLRSREGEGGVFTQFISGRPVADRLIQNFSFFSWHGMSPLLLCFSSLTLSNPWYTTCFTHSLYPMAALTINPYMLCVSLIHCIQCLPWPSEYNLHEGRNLVALFAAMSPEPRIVPGVLELLIFPQNRVITPGAF